MGCVVYASNKTEANKIAARIEIRSNNNRSVMTLNTHEDFPLALKVLQDGGTVIAPIQVAATGWGPPEGTLMLFTADAIELSSALQQAVYRAKRATLARTEEEQKMQDVVDTYHAKISGA